MINVLLNGCNGKMGQELVKQIHLYPNISLSCGIDIYNNKENSFPVHQNFNNIVTPVDVIIDFSTPSSTLNILEFAIKNKIPIVIATTGFSNKENEKIENASNIIPIFQSSNMSFDINLIANIVSKITPILKNHDIEIIETHHNTKKDAPSGTALLLANSINKSLNNRMVYNFDRNLSNKKREKNEIGFSSVRGGNIIGEHTVKFFGTHDTIEITHTSYSRSIYADGALKAAEFISNKLAGLYNMNDLLHESSI